MRVCVHVPHEHSWSPCFPSKVTHIYLIADQVIYCLSSGRTLSKLSFLGRLSVSVARARSWKPTSPYGELLAMTARWQPFKPYTPRRQWSATSLRRSPLCSRMASVVRRIGLVRRNAFRNKAFALLADLCYCSHRRVLIMGSIIAGAEWVDRSYFKLLRLYVHD